MKKCLLCFMFLSACAPLDKVELRWDHDVSPLATYKVTRKVVADSNLLGVDGFLVDRDLGKRAEVIKALGAIDVNSNASMLMKFERLPDNNMRALVTSKVFDVENGSLGQNEKEFLEFRKKQDGTTRAVANFDSNGELQSLTLKNNAKNFFTAFLGLPKLPVSSNETWSIPLSFISLSAPFRLRHTKQLNKVSILGKSKDEDGNTVATIFYNVTDKISGENVLEKDNKILPLDIIVSYLAVGRFVVEKNKWESYRGYRIASYSGSVNKENTEVFALVAVE